MDIVELNKLTHRKKVETAHNNINYFKTVSEQDAVILVSYALKKQYGLSIAVKILHSLGIKDLKV